MTTMMISTTRRRICSFRSYCCCCYCCPSSSSCPCRVSCCCRCRGRSLAWESPGEIRSRRWRCRLRILRYRDHRWPRRVLALAPARAGAGAGPLTCARARWWCWYPPSRPVPAAAVLPAYRGGTDLGVGARRGREGVLRRAGLREAGEGEEPPPGDGDHGLGRCSVASVASLASLASLASFATVAAVAAVVAGAT